MIQNTDLRIEVSSNWGNLIMKNTKTIGNYRRLMAQKMPYGDNLAEFLRAVDERNKQISKTCCPQEVYCEEYNNHECNISCDDEDAYEVVVDIWGEDIASTVKRF